MDSSESEKERMEAIKILLRTTEEMKASISPLIQGQADALKILRSHEEAITGLMDKLLGTQEEHKEQIESLELVRSRISKVEETQLSHESLHETLEERLGRVELEPILQLDKKIEKKKEVSVNDLKIVEDYLSLHPDEEIAIGVKIGILSRLGRKQEAQKFMDECTSKHPENARLWHQIAMSLEDLGEQLKSIDKSLELLKNGPVGGQHVVLHDRAVILANAKKFDEALVSATRSVELIPECDQAWVTKGKILSELNRIPEALGCAEKAIELNNDSAKAWIHKGLTLAALGPAHRDEAIASLNKAIDLDPSDALAYFNKAKLLIAKGNNIEAVRILDKVLEINDKKACVWCERGASLNRLDRNEEAIQSLRKALELCPPPDCSLIYMHLGIVLGSLKRFEEGSGFSRKAVEMEPENTHYLGLLAWNLQNLGKNEEALRVYEKALSLKKSDEEIHWDDLAGLYEKMGKMEQAKQAYEKFERLKKKGKGDSTTSSKGEQPD